jgi:broad specificity phosphatase PhoE
MPYLVRHAHAGDKRAWRGSDAARPLSPPGQQEANGLLARLRGYPITQIVSSPAVRCVQTVEPLARGRDLDVEPDGDLDVHADPARLLARLRDAALDAAVLCTHGELIGAVLQQLAAEGTAAADELRWPKGSTWVLQVSGGRLHLARYLPPLRLQAAAAGQP